MSMGRGGVARAGEMGRTAGGVAPSGKAMNFGPSAKRLIGRLSPERALVVLVAVFTIVSVGLSVLGPRLLGNATNIIVAGAFGKALQTGLTKAQVIAGLRSSGQGQLADMLGGIDFLPGRGIDFTALSRLLAVVLLLYFGSAVLSWLQAYLLNGIVQRTVYRLREDVERKIHALPLTYFDRMERGDLLSRVTNDIDNIAQTLQQTMAQVLTSLFQVIGIIVMMFIVSWQLAFIPLVTIPLSIFVASYIARRSQRQFVDQWRRTGTLNAQVEETFTGHALVKVFGRHREVEERFTVENEALFRSSFNAQFVSGVIMPAMMFIGNILYVVVAVAGGLRVSSGMMQLGDVQAFVQYSRQFTQPVTQLGSMANLLQSGVASAERVFELLDADEQTPDPAAPERPAQPRGRIQFEHVGFSYDADNPLIADLSLIAEPGQTVAIVGPTGAGKTTLVNLLMRFYDPQSGRILVDGVDTQTMSRGELRQLMGMVLQDTWLFSGTIRQNIAYGRPDATEDEIVEAAKATYVDRFVRALPGGYDTVIDDEGSNVSAGQKQLLTIARAFLAHPMVLILDEATSSVDTRTELLVQQAMSVLRQGRTSFVIAHRLSTIRDADLILVMEHGSIVEQGTHTGLLAAGGPYARLYNAQFAGAVVDEA